MKATRTRLMVSGLAVLGLACAACGEEPAVDKLSTYEQESAARAADTGAPDEGAAMTITGCLQEASGDLVVTVASAAGIPGAVGTSGTVGSSPGAEHLNAARQSYRLDGDEDMLRKHEGSQVRVTGIVEERSDLNAADPADRPDRDDIDTGDLTELKVASITRIADTCDAAASAPLTR